MKTLKTIGFWFVQCTWGIIMTLIGAIVALVLIITGHKPKRLGPNIYFEIGDYWGGVNLGPFFLCCKNGGNSTKLHECGHGIQNMIFGPLFPFLVALPSALRYWLRNFDTHLGKSLFNLAYFILAIAVTTGLACITGLLLHIKWLTITIEVFRLYFISLSIWLSGFEIRKYDKGYVEYDAIWFEGQATYLGEKYYG